MPESDAYVRYLLKSSALDSENLKSIDVLCLDPDGSVEKRYTDFVTFPYFRFFNRSVVEYLAEMQSRVKTSRNNEIGLVYARLEEEHERFVASAASHPKV